MSKYLVVDLWNKVIMYTDNLRDAVAIREMMESGVIYKLIVDYDGNEVR